MAKYILASTSEHQRLRLQAELWEPEAERLLDEIGLLPGCVLSPAQHSSSQGPT
jgi:hypothetical protein